LLEKNLLQNARQVKPRDVLVKVTRGGACRGVGHCGVEKTIDFKPTGEKVSQKNPLGRRKGSFLSQVGKVRPIWLRKRDENSKKQPHWTMNHNLGHDDARKRQPTPQEPPNKPEG